MSNTPINPNDLGTFKVMTKAEQQNQLELYEIRGAIRDRFLYACEQCFKVEWHPSMTGFRLSCIDGFGGWLVADVANADEAVEQAGAWIKELGIDMHGSLAPKAGMFVTRCIGSDRLVSKVDSVSDSGKTFVTSRRGDSDQVRVQRNKKGMWASRYYTFYVGHNDPHWDPHF